MALDKGYRLGFQVVERSRLDARQLLLRAGGGVQPQGTGRGDEETPRLRRDRQHRAGRAHGTLGIMGDEVRTAKPHLDVVVLGTGPLERVDVLRNGKVDAYGKAGEGRRRGRASTGTTRHRSRATSRATITSACFRRTAKWRGRRRYGTTNKTNTVIDGFPGDGLRFTLMHLGKTGTIVLCLYRYLPIWRVCARVIRSWGSRRLSRPDRSRSNGGKASIDYEHGRAASEANHLVRPTVPLIVGVSRHMRRNEAAGRPTGTKSQAYCNLEVRCEQAGIACWRGLKPVGKQLLQYLKFYGLY